MMIDDAGSKRSPVFYALVLVGSIIGAVLIGRLATSGGYSPAELERQQAIERVFDELRAEKQKIYREFSESSDYFERQAVLISEAKRRLEQLADGRTSLDVFARVSMGTVDDEINELRRSEELWSSASRINAFLPSAAVSEGHLKAKIRVLSGLRSLAEERLETTHRFPVIYEERLLASGFDPVSTALIIDDMLSEPQFAAGVKIKEVELEQIALVLKRAEFLLRNWGEWWLSDESVYFNRDDQGEEYSRLVSEYEATFATLEDLAQFD